MKKKKKHKNKPVKAQHSEEGSVRAKKYLGQHFLKDEAVAKKIGNTLKNTSYNDILEIGPGMGMLTKYLLQKGMDVTVMELDGESVTYLNQNFRLTHRELLEGVTLNVVEGDFLKYDLNSLFGEKPYAITGNFPYNISTQIVFKMLENRNQIPEFSGMFQKEVAQRISAPSGNKTYGILSVLAQAFYDVEYLFTVPPEVFDPPPKVESGVLCLTRKDNYDKLGCDVGELFRIVKMAFQQRRKTLRNSLKQMNLSDKLREKEIFGFRPEQLDVDQFVLLVNLIKNEGK